MSAIEDQLREIVKPLVRELVREELAAARAANDADTFLSAQEAGDFASVADATIRRWVREGRLPGYKAGRVVRVKRSELEALLAGGSRRASVDDEEADMERRIRRHFG